jgi:hypothetical protein
MGFPPAHPTQGLLKRFERPAPTGPMAGFLSGFMGRK